MANVYISLLGTNDYLPCNYLAGDRRIAENVRFVQEATIRHRCADWTAEDRILIFTTGEAFKKNWLDDGRSEKGTREGLETRLEAMGAAPSITRVDIPEGKNVDEIWGIFNSILDNLGECDRVVFDITHSFRSIPMLVMVVLHYAKVMKRVNLEAIDYGAMETLGSVPQVKAMDVKDRDVPLFDLTPFGNLLDWSLAIDRFLETGDAGAAARLAHAESARASSEGIKAVADRMIDFTMNVATCRGRELSRSAMALKRAVADCKAEDARPAFRHLMELLEARLNDFQGDEVRDGIAAARWCLRHNLTQQGLTILQETLVSHLVTAAGLDPHDRLMRGIGPAAVVCAKLPQDQWRTPCAENVDETRRVVAVLGNQPELGRLFKKPWNKLKAFRNDVDHAGFSDQPHDAQSFGRALQELIERVEACMEE